MRCIRGALLASACAVAVLFAPDRAVSQDRVSQFAPADEAARDAEVQGQPEYYDVPWSNGTFDVSVVTSCSETRHRKVDVEISWESGAASSGVRVDISAFSQGFANGDFLASPVVRRAAGDLYFADADPGVYYYWRLLSPGPTGLAVAAYGRFEAPVCPRDGAPE